MCRYLVMGEEVGETANEKGVTMEAAPLRVVHASAAPLLDMTVEDSLPSFRASELVGYTPRSAKSFMSRFVKIITAIGAVKIRDLSIQEGEKLRFFVMSQETSLTWKASIRQAWIMYCRWLLKEEVAERDYSIRWGKIRIKQKDLLRNKSDFSREEIAKIADRLDPPMRLYLWASCYTGQRLANLLTWEYREIGADRVWTIPASKFKQGHELRFPIASALYEMLLPLRAPQERVLRGIPKSSWLRSILKAAAEKAGIDPQRAHPHNFRRTCLRWLKESGVTREQARALFCWASDAVMLRHYWPPTTDEENWAAVRKL